MLYTDKSGAQFHIYQLTPPDETSDSNNILNNSGKRILGRISYSLRMVVFYLAQFNSDILKYLKEQSSVMVEGYSCMVRIVLLNKNMSVEASHLRNSENTDYTE